MVNAELMKFFIELRIQFRRGIALPEMHVLTLKLKSNVIWRVICKDILQQVFQRHSAPSPTTTANSFLPGVRANSLLTDFTLVSYNGYLTPVKRRNCTSPEGAQ
jgi:hypothetical protein